MNSPANPLAAQLADKALEIFDRRTLAAIVTEPLNGRNLKALMYYVLIEEHGYPTEYAQRLVGVSDDFFDELRKRLLN